MNIWQELWTALKQIVRLPFHLAKIGFQRFAGLGLRKIGLFIITATVLIVVSAVLFVKATSTPNFCRSCHIMEPYFASWETSAHKNVQCIKCHIPPGVTGTIHGKFVAVSMLVNYATGIYKRSKPWAEIEDVNCTASGCHDTRLLKGVVNFKEGIKFDHTKHLTQEVRHKQLRCTSCHSQIVQGSHITVTETTCFLCHFKGRDYRKIKNVSPEDSIGAAVYKDAKRTGCVQCHDAPVPKEGKPKPTYDHTGVLKNKIVCQQCHGDMKYGDSEVSHERCSFCHASQNHINRIGETEFIHKKHVTERKVDCTRCHTPIQHRSKSHSVNQLGDCNSCHSDLHDATELLFRGTGGTGLPDRPDRMWLAGLSCGSCHQVKLTQEHFRRDRSKREKVLCTPCHDASYQKLVPQWRDGVNRRAEQLHQIILDAKKRKIDETARWMLNVAEGNVNLVLDGGGQHNVNYAEDLLRTAYEQSKLAVGNLPPFQTKQPPKATGSGEGRKDCQTCHTTMETVNKLVRGYTFPHGIHLAQKFECKKCHSETEHGKTLPTVYGCTECHHQNAKTEQDCKECHKTQRAMYEGTANRGKPMPSAMSKAGVECTSCHGTGKDITRPKPESCVECHDKTYIDVLRQWQKDEKAALSDAQDIVKNDPAKASELRKAIQLVTSDGSKGAHNPELVRTLLKLK